MQSLSSFELQAIAEALDLAVPPDAALHGVWWEGEAESTRNYRLTMWRDAATPLCSTWLAERAGAVFRLKARPATPEEIQTLLEALEELGIRESVPEAPIAEVEYDCRYRSYQLCFTALEHMIEGKPYKRWIFRRHRDGRPLSVGYLRETRRGDAHATLPGASILRGNPWAD
ncbi:MAG: hypothetical protein EOO73_21300 [Myxococcales bacterium]|nr:MAG: hypothetical protein EOO73_21300 [Myxococcales bacterium]